MLDLALCMLVFLVCHGVGVVVLSVSVMRVDVDVVGVSWCRCRRVIGIGVELM